MRIYSSLVHRIKLIDYRIYLLLILCCISMLVMHYSFYSNGYIEWLLEYTEVVNLFAVVFDVSFLLVVFLSLIRGPLKGAIAFVYVLTLVWSFVNIFYGRFFYQYLPLSAISEVSSLGEGLVLESALSGFRWQDVLFIMSVVLFMIVYRQTPKVMLEWKSIFRVLIVPVVSLLMTFAVYTAYHFIHPHYRYNIPLYQFRLKEFLYDAVGGGTPNLVHFQTGSVRVGVSELVDLFVDTKLTNEQQQQILDFYSDNRGRYTDNLRNPEIRNVIFILLESFLSSPIDLVENGKEITPFLNAPEKGFNSLL